MLDQTSIRVSGRLSSGPLVLNGEPPFRGLPGKAAGGFDHHLVKPVDPDELTNLLASV